MKTPSNNKQTINYAMETLLEVMPGHIYWLNKDNVLQGCNHLQASDIGLDNRQAIVGKNLHELYPKKHADLISQNNKHVMASGVPQTFEEPEELPNGEKRIWLSHKVPLIENDEVVGIIGISTDITEQKEREQALTILNQQAQNKLQQHQAELAKMISEITGTDQKADDEPITYMTQIKDYYEQLIALMPGHVYWLDKKGVYLGCNNKQAASAGLSSRDEIIGKTNAELPWNYHSANLPDELDASNQTVMQSGEPVIIEEPGHYPNGEEAVFLSSKVPLRNKQAEVIGLLGVSLDITTQKQAERLKAEKEEAENKVTYFRKAAGSIAHDLRTPLASIKLSVNAIDNTFDQLVAGYEAALEAGLIKDGIRKSKLNLFKEALTRTQREVDFSNTYIDLILGNLKYDAIDRSHYKHHQIKAIVASTIEAYPIDDHEKSLINNKITQDFTFNGHNIYLKNALNNLLKNSLYYIKAQGKGEISIWTECAEQYNILCFKDTAKGAPPEVCQHMFDGYYSTRDSGTGLGLAFCKSIMKSFGGTITVESKENEFILFRLNFPKLEE